VAAQHTAMAAMAINAPPTFIPDNGMADPRDRSQLLAQLAAYHFALWRAWGELS
jgi:hypothetical protein